jgi:hypothetical protein
MNGCRVVAWVRVGTCRRRKAHSLRLPMLCGLRTKILAGQHFRSLRCGTFSAAAAPVG